MFAAPTQLIQVVTKWHVRSQQVARRNAMVSCTALAERRRELAEVEEFLSAHAAARAARTATLEVQVRPA
ncbi:MAG TPA: hypothetical protein VLB29_10105 [Nocardioidaceae bacterium]|nr:hypothetical protein [Nocardioidaceae bacterium]